MEYNSATKNCQNCKSSFTIESNDFSFYEKMNVPPPTFCPDCRRQRRWAWRNNVSLYNRKCDLCGKSVVSIYSPDSGFTIYCNKCWWSDQWDPKSFAQTYDFSKPFFTQFMELVKKVPQMAIVNDDGIASVNCEYTQDWWFSKNCYMCFSGWHTEYCMYSYFVLAGKYVVDCNEIRSPNEWIYECRLGTRSYNVKYAEMADTCIDSSFLYDCRDCKNCFMCTGLRSKKHCFKNKQYSKEEYDKILESYRLDTYSGVEKAKKEFAQILANFPRKFANVIFVTNCTGDTISRSKNTKASFGVRKMENCSYCDFCADDKDALDLTTSGELSECYEGMVVDHSQANFFGLFSVKSQNIKYCQHCHNVKNSFGCVGMRNSKYSILNKEYTKEEYQDLLPKIIEHMNSMPYIDKEGHVYGYGEFYPIELSPFGYNETYAPEITPLSKEEALSKGYKWQDSVQKTEGKQTLSTEAIPDSIRDIDEGILKEVLECISCRRNYRIVPNELMFYKKMDIPIPRKCFHCRNMDRVAKRSPLKLWKRECMCIAGHTNHTGKCTTKFESPYSPERQLTIYCEKCYQQEVY
jgi:hypothetical protein